MKTAANPRPKPKSALRAERRSRILKVAAKLFASLGYAECDMDRVAARLKIAKGTIYLYFPSKQELFRACVDDAMFQMRQQVQAAADAETDPFGQMAQAIRVYLTFFANHPHYVELLIQEHAVLKNRKRLTYFEHREAARKHWRSFYQGLIDEGRLRPHFDVESILDTIGNLSFGTMFTNHFAGPRIPIDEQVRRMLDIVLQGVLSNSERKKKLPAI